MIENQLPGLAAKISQVLGTRPEYFVTQPSELHVFRQLSDSELRDFAYQHGWNMVRRVGGRQIEFYNDAARANE